jgi:GntR family transcriptional regulator, rspAB operon transcriptional repressor
MLTRTIADNVYDSLRSHILNQTFAPGQRLQVDELAQQFGVSRTPVKDALNLLAAQGLVRITPRRSTYVAELSIEEVIETYEVRLALELAAGERLVTCITPAILSALDDACRAVETAAQSVETVDEHLQKNFEFHELFVESSGNRKLLDVYRSLHAAIQIARIHHRPSSNWYQRLGQETEEHRAIMRSLQDGDVLALTQAIRTHLNRAKDSLVGDMQAANDRRQGL